MSADKVREDRLRRMASRRKLRLQKNRRRDPQAYDYGYWTIYSESNRIVGEAANLDELERWLTKEPHDPVR